MAVLVTGCGKPNRGSIDLRKSLQARDREIADLHRRRAADAASLAAVQSGRPVVDSLPSDRLEKLFTTSGIRLGRLTGGANLSGDRSGFHDGLKVYVVPHDETGDELKAGGAITVEAFDLASEQARVGEWRFSAAEAKALWNGHAMLYEYVVPCKWQTPPKQPELTLKVTFQDELTGRSFTAQTIVRVKLQP